MDRAAKTQRLDEKSNRRSLLKQNARTNQMARAFNLEIELSLGFIAHHLTHNKCQDCPANPAGSNAAEDA